MRYTLLLILFAACILTGCTRGEQSGIQSNRREVSFNDNWKFSLNADSTAIDPSYDDVSWRSLSVPHDWSIEGKFDANHPAGVGGGALPGGLGWYRKTFRFNHDTNEKVFIRFDGVYCRSEVWINGVVLGRRPNGYITFQYDLTPHLKKDADNVLVVKVDNSQQPNSRWYSGSGIYRNVWLTKVSDVHIDLWGVHITTPTVTTQQADISVKTVVNNSSADSRDVVLKTSVKNKDGVEVGSGEQKITLGPGQRKTVEGMITVANPELWSVDSPTLYTVVSVVEADGKNLDAVETPFGIRTFAFDSENGFSLNGKPMKILGVCNHHDLGALGAALNERALERQLEIMRGMGVNAIRTSHNPPAPELLDLCDKMGFIVMDEVFDMWKKGKSTYDYSLDWDEWYEQDLRDFIVRDRNHPSVLIWSVGNEILEQWDTTGATISRRLASIVSELDDTRPITTGNNDPKPQNNLIKSGAFELIGYNYAHQDFASFPERFPGGKFIATETTSALATRGHYDLPSDTIKRWPISWDKLFTEGNKDNTVSAYDHVSTPWGSTHEETWKIIKKHPFLSGMFIWTGFDYLGEPTPYVWPSRSSYFGVVDLAGFPKDVYYMYQSEWTSKDVLHIFPHWNWNEGQDVDVWAYYNNADEVELFVNDKSVGVRKKENDDLHVMWRVPFTPGTLKAVSRKDGRQVLSREIKTAGEPAMIELIADRKQLSADGKDLSFITVRILDKDGNLVPDADNKITFTVEGAAAFVAADNGDPTSHESFQSNDRKAFHGLALGIVRSTNEAGAATVNVSADGLEDASVKLTTK